MDEINISEKVDEGLDELVKLNDIKDAISFLHNHWEFYKQCSRWLQGFYSSGNPDLTKLLRNILFQTYCYRVIIESGDDFFDFSQSKDTFRDHDFFEVRDAVKKYHNERPLCYKLLMEDQGFQNFPIRLIDREVPLVPHGKINKRKVYREVPSQPTKEYPVGKVDLVGYDEIKNRIVLIEAKTPDSSEPLIRAISEIVTYSNQINKECFVKEFNRFTGKSVDPSSPFELMIMTGEGPYRLAPNYILDMIKKYDVNAYIFKTHIWDIDGMESMIPLKVTESQIEDFKTYKHFLCGNNQKENLLPYYDYIEKQMDRLCREIDERIGR